MNSDSAYLVGWVLGAVFATVRPRGWTYTIVGSVFMATWVVGSRWILRRTR